MTENPQIPEGDAVPSTTPAGEAVPAEGTPTTASAHTAPSAETTPSNDATPVTPAAPAAPAAESPAAPAAATTPVAAHSAAPAQPGAYAAAPAQPAASIYDIPPAAQAGDGSAFGPAATKTKAPRTARRGIAVPVIAALAVGAILGGASGAGIASLIGSGNTRVVTQTGTGTNVTVNRTDDATTVTAVAAKASASVVTISVSGGQSAGTGSGIVLTDDGYILTNTHVVTLDGSVADAAVTVQTADGKIYDATIVGTDPVVDLAVIKLTDASGLTPMDFADSDNLNVGDTAVAIGAPLGLSGTVTDGIVSALGRSITVASSAVPDTQDGEDGTDQGDGSNPYDFWNFDIPGQDESQQQQTQSTGSISVPVIQTDAAINPGNSGGALLNSSGELIGVNVAIASAGSSSSSQSGSIGVGFAIPSNLAKRVADEIIADGVATHGLLGASVADSTSADETAKVAGAYIDEVVSGGAAEQAGLKSGDIITQFNGVTVGSSTDLTAQVRYLAAGAKADLQYVRGGKTYEATVTLGTLSL
ncbi:S1C family serine protease [Amnibacterium flavum]|uniref:Serine protease n=1 Tax=Amnibacterium flavum TaxID=2173173 RepID=A0A2V1HRU0_9MICO|nr:trypsin-like peptidase domain-containing protein [Amnibacterium flavum]PVZ93819.1 serine protease [Amnibacterium flavum]